MQLVCTSLTAPTVAKVWYCTYKRHKVVAI